MTFCLNKKVQISRIEIGNIFFILKFIFSNRQMWKSLGDMDKEEAMQKYINLVVKVCPLFTAHLEANKRHLEEEQKRLK